MKRTLLPIAILAVLGAAAFAVLNNPPDAQRGGPPAGPQTSVDVITIAERDYRINIASYGTVQPRTQSFLVAQVGGQVVSVSNSFRPGGFFAQGDLLLTIDPRDFEANVNIAQATLMDALQAEAQEAARAEQARIDWQNIGKPGETPNDLVLRVPQLKAAQARVASARAALERARLDLARTRITAPYSGRMLEQRVDMGQVVTPGTQLGEIYATDYAEIRLPVRNADLAFIDLPEADNRTPTEVAITSTLGIPVTWAGAIVRTEGAIDAVARQLHVIAQIDDPFGVKDTSRRPLKIGEYVTAEITGNIQNGAIIVPAETIYQNTYVYVVEDELLQRRNIRIAWQNGVDALISEGLAAGDRLVTTPLGQMTSGTHVAVREKSP